jgi:hypothetical protein
MARTFIAVLLQVCSRVGATRQRGHTFSHAFGFGPSAATSARRAVALSFLLGLRTLAAEPVEIVRVPFSVGSVEISIEMPKRWAAAPFPIHPIPSTLPKILSNSGLYAVWVKEWGWNRSFFRGGLGHMHCDAWINRKTTKYDDDLGSIADPLKKRLLVPDYLLAFVSTATANSSFSSGYRFSLCRLGSVVWVRLARVDEKHQNIPTAESWYLGLSKDTYLNFDFACIREAKGEPGDKWLAAALYWQHRMIASLQVTGLKQYPSGKETITDWKFPEVLRPDPEFLK